MTKRNEYDVAGAAPGAAGADSPGSTPADRGPLLAGLAAMGVHAAGLVVAGIFLLVRSTGHDASSHQAAVTQGCFALLGALIFAGLAFLLVPPRVNLAARTPSVILEALLLPVAIGLLQSGRPGYGVPLLVTALVGAIGIPVGTRGRV